MPDEKQPEKPVEESTAVAEPTTPAPEEGALKSELKKIEYDGYSFEIDQAMLDDVELLEMIDAIEGNGNGGVIIRLLIKLIGKDGYAEMKDYFVKKDGRFKMSKLFKIYDAIFEDFDPKG